MTIGSPEGGRVSAAIDMSNTLYVVKERAIYAVQLVDQMDPERTNVAVPNTQQRIMAMGSQSPEVARILLIADAMFKSIHLGEDFPAGKARSLAFEYLRDIAAMKDMYSAIVRLGNNRQHVECCYSSDPCGSCTLWLFDRMT